MNKPRYADVSDPTLEAIIYQLFRFNTEAQAQEKLDSLKETYITSKHQIPKQDHPSIILWVRGYEVTKEEEEKGGFGNFALISYKKLEDGKLTLYAMKLDADVKRHPQRKRLKQPHPNWGHPILRRVKPKKKVYETVEEAQGMLEQLHSEFPDISIPVPNKLFIIIYSRQTKPPIQKYVLEIKAHEQGGFWIDYYLNDYQEKKQLPHQQKEEAKAQKPQSEEEKAAQGYFSSMVALKRNKKRKKPPIQEAGTPPENPDEGSAPPQE